MGKVTLEYRKEPAFVNREKELRDLDDYINIRPEKILFLHGPKSSGKTTLLYKFFDNINKERKLDVKFMNLRERVIDFPGNSGYRDFLSMFFNVTEKEEQAEKITSGINVGLFKVNSEIERKMKQGRIDPFQVMKAEFSRLTKKGKKPVMIIDELQALDNIYMDNSRDRHLLIEILNFFVAMTKESHLAHIIIASSDGYFLNRLYADSRLSKTSRFYKVDYLEKKDVMEWLLNLKRYSKIEKYSLNQEEAEKIWDTVGGSMWEIQDILDQCFSTGIDEVLDNYKENAKGFINDYLGGDPLKRNVLSRFIHHVSMGRNDFSLVGAAPDDLEETLRDMVNKNILYFDPTGAVYYPQSKGYREAIRSIFSYQPGANLSSNTTSEELNSIADYGTPGLNKFDTGIVPLNSPFYIEREQDIELMKILQDESLVLVQGAHKTGKSSLLRRAEHEARKRGYLTCYIDFQSFENNVFDNLGNLLRRIAQRISLEFKRIEDIGILWDNQYSDTENFTLYIEKEILERTTGDVLILMDDVDLIVNSELSDSFFSTLRYWHDRRYGEKHWDRLHIVIAHYSSSYTWIRGTNRSPFNVGYWVKLGNFNNIHIRELNSKYGNLLKNEREINDILELTAGHPFLVRWVFHSLTKGSDPFSSWKEKKLYRTDDYITGFMQMFRSHLEQDGSLKESLVQVLKENSCKNISHFERLKNLGLVKGEAHDNAQIACTIYKDYFNKYLDF